MNVYLSARMCDKRYPKVLGCILEMCRDLLRCGERARAEAWREALSATQRTIMNEALEQGT